MWLYRQGLKVIPCFEYLFSCCCGFVEMLCEPYKISDTLKMSLSFQRVGLDKWFYDNYCMFHPVS